MQSQNQQIKDSKNPVVKDLADDRDKAAALESVALTEGGKLLIDGLVRDLMGDIENIGVHYKTLTMQEFISLGANINVALNMVRALTRAAKTKKLLSDDIERLLIAELED